MSCGGGVGRFGGDVASCKGIRQVQGTLPLKMQKPQERQHVTHKMKKKN